MNRTKAIDQRIDELEDQLDALTDERAVLVQDMGADVTKAETFGARLAEINGGCKALQDSIAGLLEAREAAIDADQQDFAQQHEAVIRAHTEQLYAAVRQDIELGQRLDNIIAHFKQALVEVAERGEIKLAHAQAVARATHPSQEASFSALAPLMHELRSGSASNALMWALIDAGVGRVGIPADVLTGYSGQTIPLTFEAAFSESASRVEERVAGWTKRSGRQAQRPRERLQLATAVHPQSGARAWYEGAAWSPSPSIPDTPTPWPQQVWAPVETVDRDQ